MEIEPERADEIRAMCISIKAAEDLIAEGAKSVWLDLESRKIILADELDSEVIKEFRKKYGNEVEVSAGEPLFARAVPISSAYLQFPHIFSEASRNVLGAIIERTMKTGREHAAFFTDSGTAIAIEGEERRVLFPPSSLCAAVHTHPVDRRYHPMASCFPSKADMRNAVSFYLDGGLLFGIGCSSYILYFQRTKIITDDVLEDLAELPNKIEKIAKRAAKESIDVFGELTRATEGLPLKILTYHLA